MRTLFVCLGLLAGIACCAQMDTIVSKVYTLNTANYLDPPKTMKSVFYGSGAVLLEHRMMQITLKPKGSQRWLPSVTPPIERFYIVKNGPLRFTLNGASKTMDRGSVALILPGDDLKIENPNDTEAGFYQMDVVSANPNLERGKADGSSFLMDWKDMVFKPHDKGGVRQLFDRKTAMLNRFDIHVTQLNEGMKSHDPHHHKNEEIILMLEGHAEMQIGQDHQKAEGGDVVYLSSNILHNLSNIGKGPCLYFAIQWN